MTDSSSEPEIDVADLANEYLERCRAGQRPRLTEYTEKYPALAEEIRDVFPMMLLMEDNAPASEPAENPSTAAAPERLGDFRILREIGRGGMGVVYEATQESLGRQVALKVCPTGGKLSQRAQERFRRESRSAAMLHHTNIVPVFAVGEDDGMLFYAMQFIRGATLDDVVEELKLIWQSTPTEATTLSQVQVRTSSTAASEVAKSLASGISIDDTSGTSGSGATTVSLPGQAPSDSQTTIRYWDSVARIGVQTADALAYAHTQGTLHRDIKPANLMLDASGAVWVMDFGLARPIEDDGLTQTGELVGTIRYMAPEQCLGEPEPASDVYSLGLTLYELLVLRPAFEELNRSRLLRMIAEDDPVPPRKLNAAIPRDLETIVLKSIAKEPNRRYANATELKDDLTRFLNREPIQARPISGTERLAKWIRRRPVVAGLSAALVVLFCVSFALVTWNWLGARAARDDAIASADEAKRRATSERRALDRAEKQQKLAEDRLTDAKYALYRNAISRAELTSRTDIQAARQVLDSLIPKPGEPDLRGWEWGYLNRLISQELAVFEAGTEGTPWIWALAFSKDESLLAVGAGRAGFVEPNGFSPPGRVSVWNTETFELVADIPLRSIGDDPPGQGRAALALAFTSDNKRLAVSVPQARHHFETSWSGEAIIWDLATTSPVVALQAETRHRIVNLQFSGDDRFAIGTQVRATKKQPRLVTVWDAATGEVVTNLDRSELLAVNGDVAKLYSQKEDDKGERCEFAFSSLQITKREPCGFLTGIAHPSKPFVAVHDRFRRYVLHDLENGTEHRYWGDDQFRVSERAIGLPICSYHPTSSEVAIGSYDGTVRVYSTSDHVVTRILRGHSGSVQTVTYSPSGRLLASGDWNGTVRLWAPDRRADLIDLTPKKPGGTGTSVEAVGFRDNELVACQAGVRPALIASFELATGEQIQAVTCPGPRFYKRNREAVFDGSGTVLASLSSEPNKVALTETRSGEFIELPTGTEEQAREIEISDDGSRIALASVDDFSRQEGRLCEIIVYERQLDGSLKSIWHDKRLGAAVTDIAFDKSGERLAIAGLTSDADPTVTLAIVSLADSSSLELTGFEDEIVSAMSFTDDGEWLAACTELGNGKLFDTSTGDNFATFSGPVAIESLDWHPDGTRLAGANRETVTLWDEHGNTLLVLKSKPRFGDLPFDGHVRFSPDGSKLAASQWNNDIRVWRSHCNALER